MNILVVHNVFPRTDTNALDLRIFEVVRILVNAGHAVTYLASKPSDAKYGEALAGIGVEGLCDEGMAISGSVEQFGEFLCQRGFQVALFATYFSYNRYAPYLRSLLPQCRLILDMPDISFLRCEREAALLGDEESRTRAREVKCEELAALRDANSAWVVSESEKNVLAQIAPKKDSHIVTIIHQVESSIPDYASREGLVFLGSYSHRPNVDAVKYFMSSIYPIIVKQAPSMPVTIAGANTTDEIRQLGQGWPDVRIAGYVEDHRAVLRSHRIGIVPLRYGAGVKGKIGEYLCCGLPCVSTTTGVEGMGLEHDRNALVADDPEDFARAVVRLYSDAALWRSLSQAGIAYIQGNLSVEAVAPHVLHAVERAAEIPITERRRWTANIAWYVRNPGRLATWYSKGIVVLKSKGLRETMRQLRIWLHNPPEAPRDLSD